MKWIKQNDCFMLSREELNQLVTFSVAWLYEPEKTRPIGYEEFHKEILVPARVELVKYLEMLE